MFSEYITIKGDLDIEVFDEVTQTQTEKRHVKNLVVQVGKNFIASRMIQASEPVMSHMAIGSGSLTPASSDTTLTTEVARVAITSATNADNVITYVAIFPAGTGTGPLTEAGIFNSDTAGSMLSHTTFAVVNKGANDTVSITWSITVQ